jgi:hypothetical protein
MQFVKWGSNSTCSTLILSCAILYVIGELFWAHAISLSAAAKLVLVIQMHLFPNHWAMLLVMSRSA